MKRLLSIFLLGVSSIAGAMIPSGVHVTVNSLDWTGFLGLPTIHSGSNAFTLAKPVTIATVASVTSLGWSSFDDPFVTYFMGVQNLSNAPVNYSFTFSLSGGFLGGPYTILTDSFTDSFTDGGNGMVTIGIPTGSTNIAQPQINGANVDGQGAGCTLTGAPGFSGSCNAGPSSASFPVITGPTGTLGVAVNFTLSPGDIYTFNGRVELLNSPEPATYSFVFGGVGLLLLMTLRRKKTGSFRETV